MPLQWDATGTVAAADTDVLAAQVLDWQLAQNIDDVSLVPDVLQIEVFS